MKDGRKAGKSQEPNVVRERERERVRQREGEGDKVRRRRIFSTHAQICLGCVKKEKLRRLSLQRKNLPDRLEKQSLQKVGINIRPFATHLASGPG